MAKILPKHDLMDDMADKKKFLAEITIPYGFISHLISTASTEHHCVKYLVYYPLWGIVGFFTSFVATQGHKIGENQHAKI